MFKVVTHKLCDDSILLLHLLLLQGLDMTELFSLHDHRIVHAVHRVIMLSRRWYILLLPQDYLLLPLGERLLLVVVEWKRGAK